MARPRRPEFHPRLADFRCRLGFTQEQVADRVDITVEMVRRHEHGISMPSKKYRQRYCLLYGATETELGLIANQAPTEDPTTPHAVKLSPASCAPFVPPLIVPAWLPEYADTDYLATVRGCIEQIIALDGRFGGADLVKLAERFFRRICNQLGTGAYDLNVKRDILATAGELAEVVGWLAYDANRQELVRRMNQESLYFTRLAGDKRMELLTLQNASMHAGFLNRPYEALHIADSVLNGDYQLSPRLRTLFLTRKARALAQGGDDGSLRIFKEIRSLYLEGVQENDPTWTWWIDERELAWHEAMSNQDLGDSKSAIAQFERSVEAMPSTATRGQFVHRAYLFGAQVNLNSWSAAENTMRQLQPLAVEVASTRTAVLLRKIIREIHAIGKKVPPGVLDEGEKLNLVLNTVPA
jgi:transcriptional regulator with XRE-family HTH domain